MRCSSYCTATAYDTAGLVEYFRAQGITLQLYRDIVYLKQSPDKGEIFYFPQGCLVCWGLTEVEEARLLEQVRAFEHESVRPAKQENFTYKIGETTTVDKINDILTIEGEDASIKLAIAYGLAQSIKLVSYEDAVEKTIQVTNHIPRELAEKGKISLSRKAISQQMGKLFLTRNFINLNSDFLDIPELFWEQPKLESYYHIAITYLDIAIRVEVLNRRLDVIRELFEMLTSELHHQHSAVLEMVIIFLIAFEIVVVVAQKLF